jgi:hypothetical protein
MARDSRLLFHAKKLLIRAIHGNDAPAIACKARCAPRNHAPLAITQAAFEAVAATLPLGSMGLRASTRLEGRMLRLLEPTVVNRLRAMRGAGESFSDVILSLVEMGWRVADA